MASFLHFLKNFFLIFFFQILCYGFGVKLLEPTAAQYCQFHYSVCSDLSILTKYFDIRLFRMTYHFEIITNLYMILNKINRPNFSSIISIINSKSNKYILNIIIM